MRLLGLAAVAAFLVWFVLYGDDPTPYLRELYARNHVGV